MPSLAGGKIYLKEGGAKMFNRILVPLDGSELAEQALPDVEELARAFDSEVVLVGVCESDDRKEAHMCQIYISSGAEQLEKNLAGSNSNVQSVVLHGNAAERILNYAKENDADLIFMASHGRSGIAQWSLGGTVHKVLQKVHIPLIIIRAEETAEQPAKVRLFNRILMTLDGSEMGEAALPYIAGLTGRLESEVILFRVVEHGKHVRSIGGLEYVPYKDLDMYSMKIKAEKYLDGISSQLAGTKAVVRREVRVGDSPREIIKFAEEIDCSLIAMASHGRSGIEAWVHGSVTSKVLQAGDRAVWFVPSPRNT